MTVQLITAAQALYPQGNTGPNNTTAKPGVLYVLDQPPHTAYRWDGERMVPVGSGGPLTEILYDNESPPRVTSYRQGGVLFTCSYYTEGNGIGKLRTVSGAGRTITYSYNANGDVSGEVWS